MSGQIVIALYRPKSGKDAELLGLVKEHLPSLRKLEMVTDRPGIVARSSDGTILEIFEWISADASAQAHEHPEVANIWEAMGLVAEFATLGNLPEAGGTFPHFSPVSLEGG